MRTLGSNPLPQPRSAKGKTSAAGVITVPYNQSGRQIEQPTENPQQLLDAYDRGNDGDPNALNQLANAKKRTASKFESELDNWSNRLRAMQESEWSRNLSLYQAFINNELMKGQRELVDEAKENELSTSILIERMNKRRQLVKSEALKYAKQHPTGQDEELLGRIFDSRADGFMESRFLNAVEQYNIKNATSSYNVLKADYSDQLAEAASTLDIPLILETINNIEGLADDPQFNNVFGGKKLNIDLTQTISKSLIDGIRVLIKNDPLAVEQALQVDEQPNIIVQMLGEDDRQLLLHEVGVQIKKDQNELKVQIATDQQRVYERQLLRLTAMTAPLTQDEYNIEKDNVFKSVNAQQIDDGQGSSLLNKLQTMLDKPGRSKKPKREPAPTIHSMRDQADKKHLNDNYIATVYPLLDNPDLTQDEKDRIKNTYAIKYYTIPEARLKELTTNVLSVNLNDAESIRNAYKTIDQISYLIRERPSLRTQLPPMLDVVYSRVTTGQAVEDAITFFRNSIAHGQQEFDRLEKNFETLVNDKENGIDPIKVGQEFADDLKAAFTSDVLWVEHGAGVYQAEFARDYMQILKQEFMSTGGDIEVAKERTLSRMFLNYGLVEADGSYRVAYGSPSIYRNNAEATFRLGLGWQKDFYQYRLKQAGYEQYVKDGNIPQLMFDRNWYNKTKQPRWIVLNPDTGLPLMVAGEDGINRVLTEDFDPDEVDKWIEIREKELAEMEKRAETGRQLAPYY